MEAIFQIFQILSLVFVKLSVLFFYRRLFVTGQRSLFDRVTKVLLVVMALWGVAFLVASTSACPSRLSAGLPGSPTDVSAYTCARAGPQLAGPAAFIVSDAVTDFVILALPLPMVWRLQVDVRRKLALSGVFLLGGLACLASVLRIVGFAQGMLAANGAAAAPPQAALLFATNMVFWSMLESGLALIAACLPTLRFLFTRPGWRTLRGRSERATKLWSSVASRVPRLSSRRGGGGGSTWHWSFEDRSTVAGSPTPEDDDAGSGREKIVVRESVVCVSCPADELEGAVDRARSEESRMEEGRRGPGSQETEDNTEWLRTTVDASRRSQAR